MVLKLTNGTGLESNQVTSTPIFVVDEDKPGILILKQRKEQDRTVTQSHLLSCWCVIIKKEKLNHTDLILCFTRKISMLQSGTDIGLI